MGSPELKATFDAIVEVFLFLDKNGDGKLKKKDMIKALNESSPWEKSPAHITRSRFSIASSTYYIFNFSFVVVIMKKFFYSSSLLTLLRKCR